MIAAIIRFQGVKVRKIRWEFLCRGQRPVPMEIGGSEQIRWGLVFGPNWPLLRGNAKKGIKGVKLANGGAINQFTAEWYVDGETGYSREISETEAQRVIENNSLAGLK